LKIQHNRLYPYRAEEWKSGWEAETLDSKYLNKKFTPKDKAIATSVDEEYENIIKIRKIK